MQRRRLLTPWLLTTLTVFLLAPAARAETLDEVLKSYVGQNRILRHYGDAPGDTLWLKRKDLRKPRTRCDIAVEVREAGYSGKEVALQLEKIGQAKYLGEGPLCGFVIGGLVELRLTGFPPDMPVKALREELDRLLPTVEDYLRVYRAYASPDTKYPIEHPPDSLLPPGATPPRSLLEITPFYSREARRQERQAQAIIEFVIGVDGRAHDPCVVQAAGLGLDEMALRALEFWRFEPARRNGQPIRIGVAIEVNFALF